MSKLPDVQNRPDHRGISLERVGLTNVKFPTSVLKKDGTACQVAAKVKLFANLPQEAKGHNLSRFSEVLVEFGERNEVLSSKSLPELLVSMQQKLGSKDVYARFEFDYFIKKTAPASGKTAPQAYACAMTGIKKNGNTFFILEVNVTAASVCPCSREMSSLNNLEYDEIQWNLPKGENPTEGYSALTQELFRGISHTECSSQVGMGAHNQRSQIRVELLLKDTLWIEDVIQCIEEQASAPTYPILKRPDEKAVTEMGYKNAKFSEDIARDVQIALEKLPEIIEWSLKVENEESIHPFNVTCVTKSENWIFH